MFSASQEIHLHFMEREGSLPQSQASAICPYPKPARSSPYPHIPLPQKIHLNVNKYPTRCNSMQIFVYCIVTLHVSGVTAPIIRSTKNCNRNQATLEVRSCTRIITCTGGCGYSFWYSWCYNLYWRLRLQFLVLLMMGAVTPETCRVTLQ